MHDEARDEDLKRLHELGYAQELSRQLSGFSNFAVSMSIICILAGGVTSFHLGFSATGGFAIGVGWPLACLFSLCVAATMAQTASAFPTAGGLYHWASILGGRGIGWATAWLNLAGLVVVLAAINVGTYRFGLSVLTSAGVFDDSKLTEQWQKTALQTAVVIIITASQAFLNHRGIRLTAKLTDFSGYWILGVSTLISLLLLAWTKSFEFGRLFTPVNFSGDAGKVYVETTNLAWLFAMGLLLPAYTITGFDGSAHVSEETRGAAASVPRGILRSVMASGLFGWVMLSIVVLAMPSQADAARNGDAAFAWTLQNVLPRWLSFTLLGAVLVAQYLCGLATVTSASRMLFAFARDGGVPFSAALRHVQPHTRAPAAAIWTASIASVLFTIYAPFYDTISAVCTIFLYLSYVLPAACGFFAYGRTWKEMGPFDLGIFYRPLAAICVVGVLGLTVVGLQATDTGEMWNRPAVGAVGGLIVLLTVAWWTLERTRFAGPPHGVISAGQRRQIEAIESQLESEEGL